MSAFVSHFKSRKILTSVTTGVVTGLLVALIVIGVERLNDALDKSQQQEHTRDFILEFERSVFDVEGENRAIEGANEARKKNQDFPILSREQIRLERFQGGLESLDLFLTLHVPSISIEDRFALLEAIISARDTANFFEKHRYYRDVSTRARGFFAELRAAVEWLERYPHCGKLDFPGRHWSNYGFPFAAHAYSLKSSQLTYCHRVR